MPARDPWSNPLFASASHGGRRMILGLVRAMDCGELLVPAYQRPRVWTTEQKARWVGYVLSQALLVNSAGTPHAPEDLERVRAMLGTG